VLEFLRHERLHVAGVHLGDVHGAGDGEGLEAALGQPPVPLVELGDVALPRVLRVLRVPRVLRVLRVGRALAAVEAGGELTGHRQLKYQDPARNGRGPLHGRTGRGEERFGNVRQRLRSVGEGLAGWHPRPHH
jgi:hypothetical protein